MAGGKNTFTIRGLDELRGMETLLRSMGDKADEAARPAAKAGADVLYEEVQRNVSKIKKKSGNLAAAVYRAFSKDNSPTPASAAYHITWRTSQSGLPRAPHGHLIENGHLQRYATYINKQGQWKTMIRPEMRGKPKPKRRDPQSVKDAYYVPRPGGPIQVPAQPFIRPAIVKFPDAAEAMNQVLIDRIVGDLPFTKIG